MKIVESRIFEGINIYSYRPVIRLVVDLEELAGATTNRPIGFVDKLLELMPTLFEHHCSWGRVGGFVKRLQEGTYFGHLLEHLILELQHLAGAEVIYGKTRKLTDPGIYEVVFEYEIAQAGMQAVNSAIDIINSLLLGNSVNIDKHIQLVTEYSIEYGLGPSTKAIVEEAQKRDIPAMHLGQGSLLQLGQGCYQKRVEATITQDTSCIGVDIAGDKILTKQLLSEAGIPTPWGGVATKEKEALDLAAAIGSAVTVKPFNGNQGKGVALNLQNEDQLRRAFEVAANYSDRVIVEEYIEGKHYRLLVVDKNLVAASERLAAAVIGNGVNTVEELIEKLNCDPLRGEGHNKPLTKIKVDPVVIMVLNKHGYNLKSVPVNGDIVMLRENSNLSTGGTAIDITDKVHPDNVFMAIRAAQVIGLDVAGVDIVAKDISIPLQAGKGAVIEVNAAPGLRMHHFPLKGKPRNAAGAIVDKLFPPGVPARIPIVAVTGTNGKTTVTRIIGHILNKMGKAVGMATSSGISIKGKQVMSGDTTGPGSARAVLRDSNVEVAVLETARGGIIRAGLGFDRCDVGIITNVSEDHLGVDGIESLEDMAFIKSLIAETVHKRGHVVLNADDQLVAGMAERCRGEIIYFSSLEKSITVRRQLGAGGKSVFVKKDVIVYATGNKVVELIPIKKIPCTFKGLAKHNIENVLAAISGCLALNIPPDVIAEGLMSFHADLKHNPGRLNFLDVAGINVLLDYGHNAAGYKCTLEVAKKLKNGRLIGVIGVPGDRMDNAILRIGQIAGAEFDYIIIKEDSDLRGRKPGEAAQLLRKGALEAGISDDRIIISLNEGQAVLAGLEDCRSGDMLVIFYEKLEIVLNIISAFNEVTAVTELQKKKINQKQGRRVTG